MWKRTINRNIDNIRSCQRASNHTGGRDTGGVMRMNMDGNIGIFFPDGADQTSRTVNVPHKTPLR